MNEAYLHSSTNLCYQTHLSILWNVGSSRSGALNAENSTSEIHEGDGHDSIMMREIPLEDNDDAAQELGSSAWRGDGSLARGSGYPVSSLFTQKTRNLIQTGYIQTVIACSLGGGANLICSKVKERKVIVVALI